MIAVDGKSDMVLGGLLVVAVLVCLVVENSKVWVKQPWYAEKLAAAQAARRAADTIKAHLLQRGIFVDTVNDPNQTALIGQKYTLITTDRGDIDAKLSATNPNFAAVVVALLKEAGVEQGDTVAVAQTGSFPGLNIAVYAALKTLEIRPLILTSVGASNWGANDPGFTWLDMETLLRDRGIFAFKSAAASMGGGLDRGRGLSPRGRELIREAIDRNGVPFMDHEYLEKSIAHRMRLIEQSPDPVRAYINIGGGIASLGDPVNGSLIRAGLTPLLPLKNYPAKGVMIRMGRKGIPLIHLTRINELARQYGLPVSPVPLPRPGTGAIFIQKRYKMTTAVTTVVLLVCLLGLVVYGDRKKHALGSEPVPNPEPSKPGDLS